MVNYRNNFKLTGNNDTSIGCSSFAKLSNKIKVKRATSNIYLSKNHKLSKQTSGAITKEQGSPALRDNRTMDKETFQRQMEEMRLKVSTAPADGARQRRKLMHLTQSNN